MKNEKQNIVITDEEKQILSEFKRVYKTDRTMNHRRGPNDALDILLEGAQSFPKLTLMK